jgi:hypothetical protein
VSVRVLQISNIRTTQNFVIVSGNIQIVIICTAVNCIIINVYFLLGPLYKLKHFEILLGIKLFQEILFTQ